MLTRLHLSLIACLLCSHANAQSSTPSPWRVTVISSTCDVVNPGPTAPECGSEARVYNVDDGSYVYACSGNWFSVAGASPAHSNIVCHKYSLPSSGPVTFAFAGPFIIGPFQTYKVGNVSLDGDLSTVWEIGNDIASLRYCRLIVTGSSCSGAPALN